MARLWRYLLRLFFTETLALTALVVILLYLVQCLRILDVVTVKGQDLLTLFGQASLIIPLIGKIFFYICVGIGLARALTTLQQNGELHIIHSSGRLRGLFGAVAMFGTVIMIVVLLLSHFANPLSLRRYDEWVASMAADLVAHVLIPHRFAEVVPGVTVVIANRQGEGQISGFFSDDRRDPRQRRTYTARDAIVARTDDGYVLQMHDGSIQYMMEDGRFSEISFGRYDLSINNLTEHGSAPPNYDSLTIWRTGMAAGGLTDGQIADLAERTGEGLRIIGMCLLITGLAAFPSGRRRGAVPLELAVLVIAFVDRGLSTYAPGWMGPYRATSGAQAMILAGLALIAWRLWSYRLLRFLPGLRRRAA